MRPTVIARHVPTLGTLALYAAVALLAKVFVSILLEYRWYFPPNFEMAAFLIGRQDLFFEGYYHTAFYAHLVAGPAAILVGSFLMIRGGRGSFGRRHAWLGRLQVLLVTAVIVPSGLVMAGQAHGGAVAGVGFALLAITTAVAAIATAVYARAGRLQLHRKWATRSFILLCSPLLLRIVSGGAIVMGLESELFYTLNAWFSWLVPLAIYEATLRVPVRSTEAVALTNHFPTTSQGL